ncbi:MAG: TIGR04086 family membrane protein [Firmicutes bacterium]|nr:TIGR04086 family membrane protein [Bacillota bacterium]
MPSIKKEDFSSPISVVAVLKGTLWTIAFTLVLSIGTGVFYHFSSVTEQTLPWFAAGILAVSVFSGSLAAGKEAGNKGLYHGLAVGLLFFLAVWLATGLLMPGQAALGIFYKMLISAIAGALGGVIGVGLS